MSPLAVERLTNMTGYRKRVLTFTSLSLGLLWATPGWAATATEVNRSDWTGGVSLPSYVQMYVYAPATKAAKPAIVVSGHSCGSTASGQMGNITHTIAAADKYGFIIILPDNPGQNCWDVGSSKSLKHDGGGDTQAVAQMVKYALTKYNGDPSRVYIFGGSSGGMLTQAMLAVYPDVFKAGSARAGVPAGCWADGYDSSKQWSNSCAGGSVSKTATQWGDLVRGMDPGYTGHRPRVQLIQGGSDTTISSKNMAESIKEWTDVLGLDSTPTSSDKGFQGQAGSYDRQFWKNTCGFTVLESWVAPGKDHSMAYEEDAILKFFGLDAASTVDPEDAACGGGAGDAGAGGAGGASGADAASSAGGAGGGNDGGLVRRDGGGDVTTSGGAQGSGGGAATGGAPGAGGSGAGGAGAAGRPGSGGSTAKAGTGGAVGSGGATVSVGSGGQSAGGAPGSGGASAKGGAAGSGSSTPSGEASSSTGCGCVLGAHGGSSATETAMVLLAGLGLLIASRRRPRG
jgi:poly(hydroxyalkanoate) depolymerase family esterase